MLIVDFERERWAVDGGVAGGSWVAGGGLWLVSVSDVVVIVVRPRA